MRTILTISLLLVSIFANQVHADNDGRLFNDWFKNNNTGVSAVQFQQYNDICGRCHFAYQPGLLPAVSWEKVMMNIDQHFKQAVQLTDVEKRTIMRYLLDNSAGHVNDDVSNKILESLKYNPVPTRITQTPYWKFRHQNINKEKTGKPMFQCDSCHSEANNGNYDSNTTNLNINSIHVKM